MISWSCAGGSDPPYYLPSDMAQNRSFLLMISRRRSPFEVIVNRFLSSDYLTRCIYTVFVAVGVLFTTIGSGLLCLRSFADCSHALGGVIRAHVVACRGGAMVGIQGQLGRCRDSAFLADFEGCCCCRTAWS